METVQQNGRFTLFSSKFLSIYSILYVYIPCFLPYSWFYIPCFLPYSWFIGKFTILCENKPRTARFSEQQGSIEGVGIKGQLSKL